MARSATKAMWKPWHKVVKVRDDLRSGELSLAAFAADLYDVVMEKARPVYQKPKEFFALTYPTYNLRELAKDVILRLAGKSEKAVRQLELTYGGGKTHTLITLLHLVSDPKKLPKLPAVKEFVEHAGMKPPRARVAVLPFDKLDVEKGMEMVSPDGKRRWLRQPWSVLAWQIAGEEGLKLLHSEGHAEERESAPAENLMVDLLSLPAKDKLATLILVDEVLMYAREKVDHDPKWRGRLQNFFQYLTQAVTKVPTCAMVASLLATDPRKSDKLGKEIASELHDVFAREKEEGIQPVTKGDVAEILRRRFFTPESMKAKGSFRSHVVAALKGITALDDQTKKEGNAAEERYLASYPFHPDLTEVFYTKWTQLEGFQRTRGVLRTFAIALREAEKWDGAPLVSTNIFLARPDGDGIAEGLRELTGVASAEEYEGKRQEWTSILEGELQKARDIQSEAPGLKRREVEQAVLATFLHSQPIGAKALTREIMVLLGATRPDKIELEKALLRWTKTSWFLDEESMSDTTDDGEVPKSWRLGSKPNLVQMHAVGCGRVPPDAIKVGLIDAIQKAKGLTAGAQAAGARVHVLPIKPADIEDNGEFHYAVLGPNAASASGSPSAEAKRFINETTSADKKRVYRNSLVLAVPSKDGLDALGNRIREQLGWVEVRDMLKGQDLDPVRASLLASHADAARKRIPEAAKDAYCIVVTVDEKNDIHSFKVTPGGEPLFATIKNDKRSRIEESEVSADALLPEGPYDLWKAGETARRVKDLVGAFAQFPHLPKMLQRQAILDTLVQGARKGLFVLRATRPDRSIKTSWREAPADADLKDASLEVVLPEHGELTEIRAGLLAPDALPGLWPVEKKITVGDVSAYFGGGRTVKIKREGYEETITIPKAGKPVVETAIEAAVGAGDLWLTSDPASVLGEPVPAGVLTDAAVLQPPPVPISVSDVMPDSIPDVWAGEETTAQAVTSALSQKAKITLPWVVVREAIDGAIRSHLIETTPDSADWPCDLAGSAKVKLKVRGTGVPTPPPAPKPKPGVRVAEADLTTNQILDLADAVADLKSATAGHGASFHVRIAVGEEKPATDEVVKKTNEVLAKVTDKLRLE